MIRSGLNVPTPEIPIPAFAVPYAAPAAESVSLHCSTIYSEFGERTSKNHLSRLCVSLGGCAFRWYYGTLTAAAIPACFDGNNQYGRFSRAVLKVHPITYEGQERGKLGCQIAVRHCELFRWEKGSEVARWRRSELQRRLRNKEFQKAKVKYINRR